MSTTYYSSLSGMMTASYGLQNTSNNMANMQSPGFKKTDVFYSSLGSGNGDEGLGSGVCISGNITNFSRGRMLDSSSPTDLAIDGNGFFIIRQKSGELLYTRNGQFSFNNEGILIDPRSGGEVQGYNSAGNLVSIHEKGPKVSAGKATHEIYLNGSWVRIEKSEDDKKTDPFKNKYNDFKCEVMNVYDAQGKAHTLKLTFRPIDSPGFESTWELTEVTYDDALIDNGFGQRIVFAGVDTAATKDSNNAIHLTINGTQDVSLRFGTVIDGSESSVILKDTKNHTDEKITIYQNDGYGEGKQTSLFFNEDGLINYQYDNGQTIKGIHVCLAHFDELEHTLTQTHDSLFRAQTDRGRHLGRPNQNGLGSIKAQKIESSNVDSTTEFANIVILQRMFQACSQIMDIDKQLLEGLVSK
jgi:flagellar hook protein FlgE